MTDPKTNLPDIVAVLPERNLVGWKNLEDKLPPLPAFPYPNVLQYEYPTDAHFVCYYVENQKYFPRLTKAALCKLREFPAKDNEKIDVKMSLFAFDYDNPGHADWSNDLKVQFWTVLDSMSQAFPASWQWNCLYFTKHGARLVYVLSSPIPVDQAEPKHKWMVHQFQKHGLQVDPLSDWTRIFRLPKVNRDGFMSWNDTHFDMFWQLNKTIDPYSIPNVDVFQLQEYGEIKDYEGDKPTPDQAHELLETLGESGRWKMSEWLKGAKKRLKGRECFDCLFNHAAIALQGARDSSIHAYVGQVVGLLYYFPGTTPEHVYALFREPVAQLQPDDQTPDWTEVLWSAVCRIWGKEQARAQVQYEKQQKQELAEYQFGVATLEGFRKWCDHPFLHGSDEEAVPFLKAHLIASVGNQFHVMKQDGYYDSLGVSSTQLVARIRALGMHQIIKTMEANGTGTKFIDRSAQSIVTEHATIVKGIEARCCIDGAFISHLDEDGASLILPTFRRNPNLTQAYNKDVDDWLRLLFGSQYKLGCKWLAWALAFDEKPTCALSIAGKQGVGKKMLVQGLAECLEYPCMATVQDLVGDYQYGLRNSPFLVVNEGWPQVRRGMHPADQFRALVGGDGITINEKFKAPVQVKNLVRVIFTANNLNVIKMLTGNRELSPDDRDALSIRLLHINAGDEALYFLQQKGGIHFTGKRGRRWIGDDATGKSDYILARHILWLYETRHSRGAAGNRLAVEGNSNDEIIFAMQTESGSTPLVIEAIIHMLESKTNMVREGLAIEEGELYVLSSEILNFFRCDMAPSTREKLTANMIANSLKGIVKPGGNPAASFVLPCRSGLGRKRWYRLNCELLLQVARRDGWPSQQLEHLVVLQKKKELFR